MPIKASAQNRLAITSSHIPLAPAGHTATPKVNAAGMSPVPLYCEVTRQRGMQVSEELGATILSSACLPACLPVEYLKVTLLDIKKNISKNLLQEP